ncbi:MAG: serine/threonine protein kinase, partial [Mycobacteriaceae bacterium]|nr:serine/threonine protein kinase [Mycobacteriaceae bacterium]
MELREVGPLDSATTPDALEGSPQTEGAGLEPERAAAEHEELPDLGERYEVLSLIGRGGMGAVYRVRDRQCEKDFAIKVIAENLLNDPVALKRFETEVTAAQKLDHANLVSVFGSGKSPSGTPYIIMELLEGRSLAEVLAAENFLDSQRALDIFVQLAAGLEFAHKDGVIHRDIKPTNVILSQRSDGVEIPKLVDFGIATMMPAADRNTRDLTQTREVF